MTDENTQERAPEKDVPTDPPIAVETAPEVPLEEQLKASNTELREQLTERDDRIADLERSVEMLNRDVAYWTGEADKNSRRIIQERVDFTDALELVTLLSVGEMAPAKAVLQLEQLALATKREEHLPRIRPIIKNVLAAAYREAVNISMEAAEKLEKLAKEASKKEASDKVAKLFGDIMSGKDPERGAPSFDDNPFSDLLGGLPDEDPAVLRENLPEDCGDPDCTVHGKGGLADKLGIGR